MGARVVDCSPGTPDSPARLRVAHGADGAEEDVSAELVLVADGFFSKTRQQVRRILTRTAMHCTGL